MQKYIKGMTLAILMTFLATMIPSYNVVAKEKNTDSSVKVQQGTESDGLIVGEVTEKREENVKHFMKDDGTFVAMMYNNPVHYKEGSEWKDIDNTLVEKDDTKGIVESKEDILKEATIFSDVSTSEATGKTIEGSDGKNSIETVEEAKESAEEQVKSDESVSKEKEISAQNKEVKVDSKSTEKAANDKEINKGKNNKVLENKSNDFKISIAQNINADKLVSINKDKYEVSWNIKSDKNVKVNKKETTDEDVNKLLGLTNEQEKKLSKKEKAELENSKKATLIKTTSSVVFEEVKPNINLEYKLISDSIKESIIINKPTDIKKFSFNFNMKNLKPELKDNQIILSDKDTGKEIMRMQAPFMVDAKGEQTDRVKLSFDKKGKGYILTLELDKEWINSKDRQYPVIVDPSFESSVRSSDIRDTFVAANDTEDKSTNMFLRVGNTPQIGATRTFIKFTNLPQLSMGDMIIDAKLYLLKIPSQSGTDGQIDVHKVTNDWNNVGLRWSNQPSIDWTIKDYQNYSSNNWQYWDITDIAKEWYTTGNNYGLCVKKNDERSGHSTYLSSDTSDSNGYPSVYFSYVNNSGLQSYWTYHSQSVGRAGTTNINDYNGNVIHVHDDVAMSGNRLPTVIKHVYNSNDRGVDIGFGPGWRLNLSQKVKRMQVGSKWYYQYIDEDGTRRYFEDTGTEMKEEYGGELILVKNSNGNFTIKDKDNNALLFNNIGDLEEITDSNGNKIDLQYYDGKLKYVVDGAGRVTRLEYSIHNMLQEIYYPDNTRVRFDYYTNIMKWVTYADGKQSVYDYDGQNNLTSVTNIDGYKMNYEYYTQSPNRIKKVTEGNTDGTVGASMSYEYSFNSTKFTDNKGNVNYYQFDNAGKTISIRDAAGYAQAYQYGDGTNVNKMTLESKLQKTVNNFITNGSAEDTSRNFTFASGGGGTGGGGFTSSAKYIGNNSLNLYKNDNVGSRYIDQNVWLQKGKTYTFSAYVKTANISNIKGKGAHLVVYYKDKTGTYIPVRSKFLTGNNEWTRLETTFTLPSDSTDNFVIARCELLEESGNAYYDALQLEEGSIANRYNLIENGDMSGSAKIPIYWYDTMNGGATTSEASDTRLTIDDSNHPSYLDGHVFKLTGRQDKDTRIHQEIKISGKAGDTFVVSGWAKGAAVPHGTFAIQPVFISSSGNQWETISFNRDSKNWQYTNGVIKAKNDFSEIHLYLTYSNNANEVMFDGIQVFKEEFGYTYQYDSKGNLISSVDLNKQNSKFEYNGNNNLIQATDPKGNKFTYQYDGKNNIIEAKTSTNAVYSFQYDKHGNPITSRVGDKLTFIQSSATYTDDGNYISELKDAEGNTTKYNYDKTKGTLTNSTDANGKVTSYSYDIFNRLLDVSKTAGGVVHKNSYTYENDRLKSITHNNDQVKYNFTYDSLGNTDKVSVGSQTLIDNDYDNSTGNLTKSTYGNGNIISSDYDNIGRVTNKKSNGTPYAEYSYDNSGNLALLNDITNNVKYRYVYDSADRLTKVTDSNNNEISYGYDENNNTSNVTKKISGKSYTTSYKYDSDNRPIETLFNSLKTVNKYDSLGRIDYKEFGTVAADGTFSSKYKTDIEYKNIANQDNASVAYQGHIENSGWIAAVKEGETCGTTGQNLRLEGIKINLVNKPAGASIKYQAHIENSGWLGWVNEGQLGGTESKGLRLEGIKIQLVNMPGYKVQYRAHVANIGWQNWVSDGELAGTEGQGIRMEALQIRIVNMNQVSTTTNKIASIDNGGNKIEYTYDKNGNIATVKQAGKTTAYQYNELNELVREDNQALGKTIIYNYDAGGNITSKREYDYTTGTPGTVTNTVAYAYGDANWKDKLTSYNGSNITYDTIGNPLTYSGYTYTWERGRQLKGISGNSKNISYKYNDSGIRTEKSVDGVVSKYILQGDKVVSEEINSGNAVDETYNTYKFNYSQNVQWTYHGFDIPVDTSKKYTYSFDAYISSDANISSTGTTFIANGEKGFNTSFNYDNTKKGTWQHFEVTQVPTTTTATVLLYPTNLQIPATTGYIKYKNVQFKEVGTSNNLFTQPTNNDGFALKLNGAFECSYDNNNSEYKTYKYNYSQNVQWSYHGFDIPVNTSKKYTYSFDAYISSDANVSSTGTTFIANGEKGFNASFNYDNTKKGTWQHFEVTQIPTTTTATILLYPTNSQIPVTTGYIVYKNVQFKEVGTENNLFTQPTNNDGFALKLNGTFECSYDNDNNSEYKTYKYNYSENTKWTYHGFDILVDTSKRYTYSFDAYISSDANISSTGTTFIANGEKGFSTSFNYDNTKKGTWQHFEVTQIPTTTTATILLYPTNLQIPATTGYISYKNVQFKEVGTGNNLFTQPSDNDGFALKLNGTFECNYDNNNSALYKTYKYNYSQNLQNVYRGFDILVNAGKSYTYSFDAYISSDANISSTGTTFIAKGENGFNTSFSYDNSKKGTWQHFEYTGTAAASTVRLLLSPTTSQTPATNGHIMYRNVKFREVGSSNNIFTQPLDDSGFNVKSNGVFEVSSNDIINYTYDGSGNLVSMNLNSVEYYYVRNLQGDIIGLIDNTGKEVVTYNYDSWGKLISIEGSLKDSVGIKNPYRYRGYRYDSETGLYYLQSRYYNPEWGRFINADGLIGQTGDLLTHNMFAYCKNNPILLKDENGFRPMISTSWDNEVAIGRGSQEYDSYKGIWGSVTNIIKKQIIDIVYGSITYNKSVPIFSNGEVGISTPKIFKYQIKLGGSYTLGPYNKVDDSFYEFGIGAEVKPLEIAIREENNYGHLNINTEINPSVGLGGKASIGLARWDRGKYGVKFNLSGEKVVGGGATIEIYWDANNN